MFWIKKPVISLRRLLKIVTDVGRDRPDGTGYIVWQELFDNGVKASSKIFILNNNLVNCRLVGWEPCKLGSVFDDILS